VVGSEDLETARQQIMEWVPLARAAGRV